MRLCGVSGALGAGFFARRSRMMSAGVRAGGALGIGCAAAMAARNASRCPALLGGASRGGGGGTARSGNC